MRHNAMPIARPPSTQLLRRRVLSIAEYAREESQGGSIKLSKPERLRLYGSNIVPIPVALDSGESEAQYETRFLDWLVSEKHSSIESLQAQPNQERSARIVFARLRAKTYVHERIHSKRSQSREDEANKETLRAQLNTQQFVQLDQYRRDIKMGKMAALAKMSRAERISRYGSSIVPIFVPLARGETSDQYETRFIAWLQRRHNTTLAKVRATIESSDSERFHRMQFSKANAMGHERFVPERKRARPNDIKYKEEEEELTHSRSFKRAATSEKSYSPSSSTPGSTVEAPRVVTAGFAVSAATSLSQRRGCSVTMPTPGASFAAVVTAHATCACRQCLLDGVFLMTSKLAELGDTSSGGNHQERSTTPFACSIDLLSEEKKPAPVKPAKSGTSGDAREPVEGFVEFSAVELTDLPTEHAREQEQHEEAKVFAPHDWKRPVAGSCPAEEVESPGGDWLLAPEERQQPAPESDADHTGGRFFDEDSAHSAIDHTEKTAQQAHATDSADPMESYLLSQYDAINQQIVRNELALDVSTSLLTSKPPTDLHELTNLHDANQAMRLQIQTETADRSSALAALIVYMWRHELSDVKRLLSDKTVCDMAPVQRASHHRCAQITSDILERREQAATIKSQLDGALSSELCGTELLATMQPLGVSLALAEREIEELTSRRRREFTTLLHFDLRLRGAVQQAVDTE